MFSSAIPYVSKEFHISTLVASLGITLYLCGFATGPLFWAPLSELYGRKLTVFFPVFVGAMFAFLVTKYIGLSGTLVGAKAAWKLSLVVFSLDMIPPRFGIGEICDTPLDRALKTPMPITSMLPADKS